MARDFPGTGWLEWAPAAVLRPTLPVTVAAWINPDTITGGDGIFTSNKLDATHAGFTLSITNGSGNLEASYGTTGGTTGSARRSKITSGANAVTTGVWKHVACCIRGAGDMDVYIGGADAGGSYSGTGGAMGYRTSVGGAIGSQAGNGFDGRIAEVGLWTVTLSAAEVLALAKGVSPARIRPGSLLGYWPLYGAALPEINLTGNPTVSDVGTTPTPANHAPVGPPLAMAA